MQLKVHRSLFTIPRILWATFVEECNKCPKKNEYCAPQKNIFDNNECFDDFLQRQVRDKNEGLRILPAHMTEFIIEVQQEDMQDMGEGGYPVREDDDFTINGVRYFVTAYGWNTGDKHNVVRLILYRQSERPPYQKSDYEVAFPLLSPEKYMGEIVYECPKCTFKIISWGGRVYVITDLGRRETCGHPDEAGRIARELGIDANEIESFPFRKIKDPETRVLVLERTGFESHCLCRACSKDFHLDWTRDEHTCPKCGSRDVEQIKDLAGTPCPKCKTGTMREKRTRVVS